MKPAFILVICVAASLAKGYVYSYTEAISLDAQEAEIFAIVPPGLAAPGDMSDVGAIATLDSGITEAGGAIPYANGGDIEPAQFEEFPAPLAVVVESGGLPLTPRAAPLGPGDTIGPDSSWGSVGYVGGYAGYNLQMGDSAFLAPGSAYVGIEFPDNQNQIHYGYLLVSYDESSYTPGRYSGTINLLQAAYETDPGVPITIAPEPAATSLLLLCGTALLKCHKRDAT